MTGDLRTREQWEREFLDRFMAICPPRGDAPTYIERVTRALVESRVLDADPDTPTTDAPVDDGLVEQIARVVADHTYMTDVRASQRSVCGCGLVFISALATVRVKAHRKHLARALVVARPWQAEVEAARQDTHAEIYARADYWREKFGRDVPVGCIFLDPSAPTEDDLAWLRDVAARGETRQP